MMPPARLFPDFPAGTTPRRPLRMLAASGQLGYGIPSGSFRRGLAKRPDMIGCDMGSIDIGPYYLGSGDMAVSAETAAADIETVLVAARALDVPLIIGTAGSAGAAPHLARTEALLREIAHRRGLSFRLAVIPADIPPEFLKEALARGDVEALPGMPELTAEAIDASSHIVGQMGAEAFRRALAAGADVVLAGRACDTGIFAALPQMLGIDTALATHMAKIIECSSLCCLPGGRDPMYAEIDAEGFVLESMGAGRRTTPLSVAAHSLYEQSDPYSIIEPEGRADLTGARYSAVDERRTRVSGARWIAAERPSIKIEAARPVGHRAIFLAAATDPAFIARQDRIFADVAGVIADLHADAFARKDYCLLFRSYGGGTVYGQAGRSDAAPPEIFILGECVAETPDLAHAVIRAAKQILLHFGFEGRLSTAGNLAFPFTPTDLPAGPVYEFSAYHLLHLDRPATLFPLRIEEIGERNQTGPSS